MDTLADTTKNTTDTSPIRRYEDDGAALPNQWFQCVERTEGTAPIGRDDDVNATKIGLKCLSRANDTASIGRGDSSAEIVLSRQTMGTAPIGRAPKGGGAPDWRRDFGCD